MFCWQAGSGKDDAFGDQGPVAAEKVREGIVVVHKVLGAENPSDLGPKISNTIEISESLEGMNLEAVLGK